MNRNQTLTAGQVVDEILSHDDKLARQSERIRDSAYAGDLGKCRELNEISAAREALLRLAAFFLE